jgi:hypothetical protein
MLADDVDVIITNDVSITTTGCADQDNGVLYVSQLISEQDHLMPGLVIHEIGHFKYTPNESIDIILNIVEDGYIERKLSFEFLGAKKFLKILFDDLIEKNFKLGDETHTQLLNTLIYNTKGMKYGKRKKYPTILTAKELSVFEQAELIDGNFDERKRISNEVRNIIKKYMPEEEKDESNKSQESNGENGIDSDDDQRVENTGGQITFDDDTETLEADEKMFNSALENLELMDYSSRLEFDKSDVTTLSVPSHQWIMKNVKVSSVFDYRPIKEIPKSQYLTKLLNSKKVSHQLFSMFMSRVAAKNNATERYMTSGKIDIKRLPYYKVTDEIFQSVQISENQPNHYFVIALDWSASMSKSVSSLFDRILELVEFCKLCDVQYKLVLFTSDLNPIVDDVFFDKEIAVHFPKIIEILDSTSDSIYEIDRKMKQLFHLCEDINANKMTDETYEQSGTPILEALLYCHGVLSKRTEQIKNIVLLTDGEDSNGFTIIGNGHKCESLSILPNTIRCYGSQIMSDNEFTLRENCIKIANGLFEELYAHKVISIELHNDKSSSDINSHMFKNTIKFNMNEKTNVFISKLVEMII